MAERFYCADAASQTGERLLLDGDEAHHLARVRRVATGEVVEVFDGKGFVTRAEVVAVGKRQVELRPVGPPLPSREPGVRVTLASAFPKGDRADWLVAKATELGVARLVPLVCERSVVDPGPSKLERLRRAVIEAAKQCGRNRLMDVDAPLPFSSLLESARSVPVKLLAHPGGAPFARWPRPEAGQPATVAVGPEGGFTEAEVESAAAAGWFLAGLGSHVLRVETAAVVAADRLLALGETG
jgi:16S rRNA (uracil1498-N3)-methyltransferase